MSIDLRHGSTGAFCLAVWRSENLTVVFLGSEGQFDTKFAHTEATTTRTHTAKLTNQRIDEQMLMHAKLGSSCQGNADMTHEQMYLHFEVNNVR